MANGLRQQLKGVVHTSSYYALDKINTNFINRSSLEQSVNINYLKSEEEKLYHEFNCNTYEEFIKTIKQLFNSNDIEVLKRFQPDELKTYLDKFEGGQGELYQEEVNFVFNFSKMNNLKMTDLFQQLGNTHNNDKIEIGFKYTPSNVKQLFNKIFKDRYFLQSSLNMKATTDLINLLMSSGVLEITTKNPTTGLFTEKFVSSPIPNFPWGATKSLYDKAVKEKNYNILNEFKHASKAIKNFICDELGEGASPALQKAIKWAWMKNFSAVDRDPAFFFQGSTQSNFISGVQGSLGEFQAAIIFTYLEQQLGRNTSYSKIIGDSLKHGEQLKTDVSIIQNLGLQVKNMTTIKDDKNNKIQLLRDLDTNIHPDKLAVYMNDAKNVLDFLANYYFNISYARETESVYNNLIKILGDYLGEIMNFAMAEVVDTVCFYFIGGKYLVPASRILEAAQELNLKNSIEITSSYEGYVDLYYELPLHKNKKNKYSPLSVEYWIHPYGDQGVWEPTGKNKRTYNRLVRHDISIHTTFNLFDDIEHYAIF